MPGKHSPALTIPKNVLTCRKRLSLSQLKLHLVHRGLRLLRICDKSPAEIIFGDKRTGKPTYQNLSGNNQDLLKLPEGMHVVPGQLILDSPSETARLTSEAFLLFPVYSFLELLNAYTTEDQKLMKKRRWNAYNPRLITNRIKSILENMNPEELDESDQIWYYEILWFWYHHAISCERNRTRAQEYAARALELQRSDHPNRITKLLWFLTHDKVEDAKKWIAEAPSNADEVEHQTGLEVIQDYERRKFWE